MKVVLLANTDWYLFNFRRQFATFLRARGAEVVFASPGGGYVDRIRSLGIRWQEISLRRRSVSMPGELSSAIAIDRLIRTEEPDVLHNFTAKCVFYGSYIGKARDIRVIVNSIPGLGHAFTSQGILSDILRQCLMASYRVALKETRAVFQNEADHTLFLRKGLTTAAGSYVIRGSGVDSQVFCPAPKEPRSRTRIGMVARLLYSKGVREYVDAARIVNKLRPDTDFWLAGEVDAGNPGSISQSDVLKWSSQGIVRFLGQQEAIHTLWKMSDIAVLPTYYGEGVPRSLIEAASCGLPLIACATAGCREIVEEGVNGLLVGQKDSDALAKAITLLIDDPQLRSAMGRESRRKVVSEFQSRVTDEKMWHVYCL